MFTIILGYVLAVILQIIAWLLYRRLDNAAIIDVFWPIVILTLNTVHLYWGYPHFGIPLVLLLIWSLRLGTFLAVTRVIPGHKDKRYSELAKNWRNKSLFFFLNFQFQGILALPLGFVLFPLRHTSGSTILLTIGASVAFVGLLIETVADWQLWRFKQARQTGLCQVGLWSFSRHPNYLGEVVFWCGLSITTLMTNPLSWIAPLYLWCLMHYITLAITERMAHEKYGQSFQEYCDRTRKWI